MVETSKVDLSGLKTMTSGEVISILNGFTIGELISAFDTYPEIYQQYGPLYMNAIDEARSENITREAQAAGLNKLKIIQKIRSQESVQWDSSDNYFQVNDVGTVRESISEEMGTDLLRIEKRAVMTISMLINWWLVYVLSNNLVVEDTITIDQRIRDGFGSIFQEKGISAQENVLLGTFIATLSDEFTEDTISLSPEMKDHLFNQAKYLQSMIDRLFTTSSSTLSIKSPDSTTDTVA